MSNVYTSENFETEVLRSEIPVLVDFYADWCGPCKMIGPIIEELAEEYAGKMKVGKVNIDTSEPIAAQYNIMTVPSVLIFKNGEVVSKTVRVPNKEDLKAAMDQQLG